MRPYRNAKEARITFPESERAAKETLAIPLYPEMTHPQVEMVGSKLSEVVGW